MRGETVGRSVHRVSAALLDYDPSDLSQGIDTLLEAAAALVRP